MQKITEIVNVRSFYRITVKVSGYDRISTTPCRLFVYVKNSRELKQTQNNISFALLGGKHDYKITSGKDSVVFSRI